MIKITKIMIVVGLTLSQFLFSTDLNKVINHKEEKKVEARSVAAVATEVESGYSIDVSSGAEFVAVYTTPEIRNINFTTDIILTQEEGDAVYNYKLARDLKINGNGFKFSGSASTFASVLNETTPKFTFHLANMVIDKQRQDGIGTFIDISAPESNNPDIILENISASGTSLKFDKIIRSYKSANVFIRGYVDNLPYDESFSSSNELVFEANSIFKILNTSTNGVNSVFGGNYTHIGENSNVHISTNSHATFFNGMKEVITYSNANVLLESSSSPNGIIGSTAMMQNSVKYEVDSGASFKVHSMEGRAVFQDFIWHAFSFHSYPGAVVEFIGNISGEENGVLDFKFFDPKIIIDSPKYFDIRNTNPNGAAYSTSYSSSVPEPNSLQILNANIGFWKKGSPNLNTNPAAPTPFTDETGRSKPLNLVMGGGGHIWKVKDFDETSSPEFKSIGHSVARKHSRIATSTKPIFNTTNLKMTTIDNPTPIIKELVTPELATWEYNGYDNSIISIDSNGIVTPLKEGVTNVNVAATGINYTVTKTITVTVSDLPVITLNPPTVFIPLNSTNIDYFSGVSAVDRSGNPLTVTKTGTVNTAVNGIYQVTYNATDVLNKTGVEKRKYVVGNGISVGNYTILAENFTKRVGQVGTSDAAVMSAADVKVFDNVTGLQIPNNTLTFVINKGGYSSTVKEYPINFSTKVLGTTLSIDVTGTVVRGNAPVITDVYAEVPLNGVFNPNTGVTASDDEDKDITNKIVVTGSVNTAVAGVYTPTYSVTDSDGNRATKTRVVLVNDGSYVVGNNFIIKASNFTKRVGQVDTSDTAIKTAAGVEVRSKTTGLVVTEAVTVNKDTYTNAAGVYPITFTVTNDTTATKGITVAVIAGNNPVINGATYKEITVGATFNPNTGVSVSDTEDTTIVTFSVTGSVNTAVAGVYTLVYSATDSDNNTVTKTRVVVVNDGSYVAGNNFVIKATKFVKRLGQVVTSDTAIKTAAGVEVRSKLTGLVVTEGVSVNKGTYTNAAGIYPISFSVISDTAATKGITGIVTAGNNPVINGATYKEITVGTAFNPNTGVSVSDTEDTAIADTFNVTGNVNTSVAGVYTLVYSVTDSDNNTVTKTRVVVVNDGSYVAGNNFIIKAVDFTKRVSQVVTSDAEIKTAAGLQVYNKTTGALVNEGVTITKGGYTGVEGVYSIKFSVTGDPTTTRTINATVVTGNKPVITGFNLAEIKVGDAFNPMTGVSAIDVEDGNITAKVTYTGSVNNAQIGVYPLTYSVTDSDNNTAILTRTIIVDEHIHPIEHFTIHANNFTKRVGEVVLSDEAIIAAAGVEVRSKTTGLVVNEAVTVNKGGYSSVVGTYDITFTVANDTTATITKVGTVVTGNKPVITGFNLAEINVGDAFNPMTGVSASDVEDKDITNKIVVTGSVNNTQIGVYPLTYSVTDSDNNTTIVTSTIIVSEHNHPIDRFMIRANNFTKLVSQVDTSDNAIISAADVKVYNIATGVLVNEPLTIDKGRYSNSPGLYPITFTVTSNPMAVLTVTGTVSGGNIPTLTAPVTTTIKVGEIFDSKADVVASDIEDGNIINKIKVDGTVNTKVAGVYLLTYSLTDSDGNTVTKNRSVVVNDGSFVIDGIYAISAHDFKIREDLFDASDEVLIKEANVKVFNLIDGTEIAGPKITVSSTGFSKKVGEYSITFSFNPKITVRANVVANLSPELTLPFMEVKQGATINPMDGVVAIDAEDGDLINEVTYGALPDTNKLGVHKLQYSVTDTFGNTTTKTRVILVNDGKHIVNGSYIFKAHDFSINQSALIDTNEELVKLSGLEIYSTTSGEKVTTGYNVNDGGYSRAPGKYTITFTIGDGSISIIGNVVVDGIKLPQTGSENGLIYLLLISTLAFSLFKRRA